MVPSQDALHRAATKGTDWLYPGPKIIDINKGVYNQDNWWGMHIRIPYQDYGVTELQLRLHYLVDKYTDMGNYLTHYIALPANREDAIRVVRELLQHLEEGA